MCVRPWDRPDIYTGLGLGVGPVLCLRPWDRLDIHYLIRWDHYFGLGFGSYIDVS